MDRDNRLPDSRLQQLEGDPNPIAPTRAGTLSQQWSPMPPPIAHNRFSTLPPSHPPPFPTSSTPSSASGHVPFSHEWIGGTLSGSSSEGHKLDSYYSQNLRPGLTGDRAGERPEVGGSLGPHGQNLQMGGRGGYQTGTGVSWRPESDASSLLRDSSMVGQPYRSFASDNFLSTPANPLLGSNRPTLTSARSDAMFSNPPPPPPSLLSRSPPSRSVFPPTSSTFRPPDWGYADSSSTVSQSGPVRSPLLGSLERRRSDATNTPYAPPPPIQIPSVNRPASSSGLPTPYPSVHYSPPAPTSATSSTFLRATQSLRVSRNVGKNEERPYTCTTCQASFHRNHDLKRHSRIHLTVKPYPCPGCEKRFTRKDALKRHLLVKAHPGLTSDAAYDSDDGNNPPSPPAGSSSGFKAKEEEIDSPESYQDLNTPLSPLSWPQGVGLHSPTQREFDDTSYQRGFRQIVGDHGYQGYFGNASDHQRSRSWSSVVGQEGPGEHYGHPPGSYDSVTSTAAFSPTSHPSHLPQLHPQAQYRPPQHHSQPPPFLQTTSLPAYLPSSTSTSLPPPDGRFPFNHPLDPSQPPPRP